MEGKALKEYELKNTKDCLEEFKDVIIKTYQDKLKEPKNGHSWNSIASGKLLNSVTGSYTIGDRTIEIDIELTDYWRSLEEGQKPGHLVPINDLVKWIRIKPVIPRQGKGGNIPTEEQLAYLIQQKIYREGTEATYFMATSIDQCFDIFKNKLATALKNDIKEIMYVKIQNAFGKN